MPETNDGIESTRVFCSNAFDTKNQADEYVLDRLERGDVSSVQVRVMK